MTLGWIKEDAEERFFEAFNVTGTVSVKKTGAVCPFCCACFASVAELYSHLSECHRTPRPFLLLCGREPGAEDAIRHSLEQSDIEFVASESVSASVDHGPITPANPATLANLLGNPGSRLVEIRMGAKPDRRDRPECHYRLRVRIPTQAALKRADKAFVQIFGAGKPHLLKIDLLRERAGDGPVEDYVGALCEYIRGVLNKDRAPGTGVSGPLSDWTEAYKRSLQVLAAMPRPLSNILAGLMRFALNDFSSWREATRFPLLDLTNEVLGPLTEGATPPAIAPMPLPERRRAVCPVDSGVSQVLSFGRSASALNRWGAGDEGVARNLATAVPFAALDRAKAAALWAFTTLRLDARDAAIEPLRLLLNNDCFGPWAESLFTGLVA